MYQFSKAQITIISLSLAIARYEGYFLTGSIAQMNHNPGNLRSWPGMPIYNGYARFPNSMDGWRALWQEIIDNIDRNLTLIQFFAGKPGVYSGYAPADDRNKPLQYAMFVSKQTGIPLEAELKTYVENL